MSIKVLIVDDSLFMRKTIAKIISVEGIEVIGTAANGKEGVELVKKLNPDVVSMDIEMPIMSGLEALKHIMEDCPVPVLMVSTLTSEGAEATIDALSIGAVDFITKKSAFTEMYSLKDELIGKIKNIAESSNFKNNRLRQKALNLNLSKPVSARSSPQERDIANKLIQKARSKSNEKISDDVDRPHRNDLDIIVIGISTGGPVALAELLPLLPGDLPVPLLIAQHMPAYFTKSLADRLDKLSQLGVKEAENGDKLLPGNAYIAPGGLQMTIHRKAKIEVGEGDPIELYKPSVNILMNSAVQSFDKKVLGIIMTGMGHDGRDSMINLNKAGGYIIAQDPATCVVPGMPNSVIKENIANEILSVPNIAEAITSIFK